MCFDYYKPPPYLKEIKKLNAGSIRVNISKKSFLNISLRALPSFEIQEYIANTLYKLWCLETQFNTYTNETQNKHNVIMDKITKTIK